MSILEARGCCQDMSDFRSMPVTQQQQQYYMDHSQLVPPQPSAPPQVSLTHDAHMPNSPPSSAEIAEAQRIQLSGYDDGMDNKYSTAPQMGVAYYGGQNTPNRIVQQNTAPRAPQLHIPVNPDESYYNSMTLPYGTISNATSYYTPNDYSKFSHMSAIPANSLDLAQFQHNVTDYAQRNYQLPQNMHPVDSTSYLHNCQPNMDAVHLVCNNSPGELRSRFPDTTNRPNRHTMHTGHAEEQLLHNLNTRSGPGVDLLVSNLDYNIGAKEWRKILFTQLQSTVKSVHSIIIQTQADGSNCAIIRVGSIEDARLAISHFHRKKIGYKRIQMNIISPNSSGGTKGLKAEVVTLLRSISGNTLPVCKFIDLFEKRFHRSISVSDLYKMRDVIEIKDQPGTQAGRLVVLSSRALRFDGAETGSTTEPVVCRRHCMEGSQEYMQAIDCAMLPSVQIPLILFRQQVQTIIHDHNGSMPLMSFPACYKADFGDLVSAAQVAENCPSKLQQETTTHVETANQIDVIGEPTQGDGIHGSGYSEGEATMDLKTPGCQESIAECASCVPLEHLLTCVPSVRIHTEMNGVRKIIHEPDSLQNNPSLGNLNSLQQYDSSQSKRQTTADLLSSSSSSGSSMPGLTALCPGPNNTSGVLLDQLHQFSREVVDLLKHQPGCQILLSKFIPSYHHHFGKQCRVADYGYSKLHELIEALPNVVHVMGSGHLRLLTLSHRVQIRRFTNELIKVLKSQSTKSCRLADYPSLFRRIYRKDFQIADYGICYLTDMLLEVSDSAVEVSYNDSDCIISLPKRVQTMEEHERTELFSIEVADLLCQSPRCRLPFNKFIPSYHHHFSRQCRVADYGFTKLIDLLEAVPNVVRIVEDHGEKYVSLIRQRHLRIVAEQLLAMLEAAPGKRILLSELLNVYLKHQGYALYLEDFQLSSVKELLSKLPRLVRIETVTEGNSKTVSEVAIPASIEFGRSGESGSDPSLDGDSSIDADAQIDLDQSPQDSDCQKETVVIDNTLSANPHAIEYVCLADRTQIKHLAHKVLLILLEATTGSLSTTLFSERFRCTFRDEPDMQLIADELCDIVEFRGQPPKPSSEVTALTQLSSWEENESLLSSCNFQTDKSPSTMETAIKESNNLMDESPQVTVPTKTATTATSIALRPLIMFARELRELLKQNQGKLLLVQLCTIYQRRYGVPLRPQLFNYPSLATLLQAVDFVAVMRGRGVRCTLILCQDFLGKLSYRVAYNTKPVLDTDEELAFSVMEPSDGLYWSGLDGSTQNKTTVNNPPNSLAQPTPWSSSSLVVDNQSSDPLTSYNYSVPTDTAYPVVPQPQSHHLSYASDMSCSPATQSSRNGTNSIRGYSNPFVTHPTGYANQLNSYIASPQMTPSSYGYYHLAQQPPGSLSHQVYATRPAYTTNNPMLRTAPANFNYQYQPTTEYAASANQIPSDCHQVAAGSYTSVLYPPHLPCGSLAVLPTGPTAAQSNHCYMGGSPESANGAVQYPGPVYPNSAMYHPYPISMNYPATTVQQLGPQLSNMAPTASSTNDPRNQTVGMNPSLAGSCSVRPVGANNYYTPDRTTALSELQRSAAVNFGQYGSSPGAQQQLDELVERLAYDNASLAALNNNPMLMGMHRPDLNHSKSSQLSNPGYTQATNLLPTSQMHYRNQLTQPPGSVSGPFVNNLSAGSDCGSLNTPYHTPMMSNYMASQNAPYSSYYTGSTITGISSSLPMMQDPYMTRNAFGSNGPIGYGPNESLSMNTGQMINTTGVEIANSTCDMNETKLAGDLSQANSKHMDQAIRSMDDCGGAKQPMISVVHPSTNSSDPDRRMSMNMDSTEHGDSVARYSLLQQGNPVFAMDHCTSKPSQFVSPVSSGSAVSSAVHRDAVSKLTAVDSINLINGANHEMQTATHSTGQFMDSVTGEVVSGLHSTRPHLATGYEVALSPEDSAGNFSLDGLLAELRLEEKQRQQQQKQQQQQQPSPHSQPTTHSDLEIELKQNTQMLLDNFTYL